MNEWQKTVAKLCKLHKGKSLTQILPLAKIEYRKTHKVGQTVKKSIAKKSISTKLKGKKSISTKRKGKKSRATTRKGKKHKGKKHKGKKQRGGEEVFPVAANSDANSDMLISPH